MSLAPERDDRVFSVLELTTAIKDTLAESFTGVWVRGEISGLKRAESGHWYFSLKQGKLAVVSCAMWRSDTRAVVFDVREGLEVEAFGDITVYEPRGNYQLTVRQMRPAGLGALLLQFEALKRRLAEEGLFDAARKRPLARYPRRIGIVTSPVGAAIRDIVKVLRTRWPAIEIVFAPARVQGPGAAEEIAAAIRRFDRHGAVDTLIVGRGGGSIEDLWAFNEEVVVRAIAASRIPVISAVGHEVDWTLADMAADVRAATPSNAGELAVPERAKVAHDIANLRERVARAMRRRLDADRRMLMHLTEKYGFRRLRELFESWHHDLEGLRGRMARSLEQRLADARTVLDHLLSSYGLRERPRLLAAGRQATREAQALLLPALVRGLHERRRRVIAAMDQLRALSPRLVLERGYCLARTTDGTVLRSAVALTPGDRLTLEFARGEAEARVETVRTGESHAR